MHPIPAFATITGYTDVPAGFWATESINTATKLGIIKGIGGGSFGVGQPVSRAQFATMLVRLFGWETVKPETPSFSDAQDITAWYYPMLETAVANGAVLKDSTTFRPNDNMTREEMAIMLVRALGYDGLAAYVSTSGMPFTDVSTFKGHITVAHDFGIINGISSTAFAPNGNATREQAAAMMTRLYNRTHSKTDWLHAFYAISSFSQSGSVPALDALSFGWSRLQYTEKDGVYLNTTTSNKNDFYIPTGYGSIVAIAQDNAVPTNLNVYMSTSPVITKSDGTRSDICREVLLHADNRASAISQILVQLQEQPFLSGVTIDFEGMSGDALKAALTVFMKELRTAMTGMGKTVYLCVPPVVSDGQYFNAYDYRALGDLCDKMILMAHDYQATSMSPEMMAAGFTTTPLTPIPEIYHALAAITDPVTGVSDIGKVALAISFNSEQWHLRDGKVINEIPYHPHTESIYQRLIEAGTTMNYSQRYENPYITFTNTEDNTQNVIWYEDERSISAKLELARMFGVNGLSVWRLGLIPNYENAGARDIHFDVLDMILGQP